MKELQIRGDTQLLAVIKCQCHQFLDRFRMTSADEEYVCMLVLCVHIYIYIYMIYVYIYVCVCACLFFCTSSQIPIGALGDTTETLIQAINIPLDCLGTSHASKNYHGP